MLLHSKVLIPNRVVFLIIVVLFICTGSAYSGNAYAATDSALQADLSSSISSDNTPLPRIIARTSHVRGSSALHKVARSSKDTNAPVNTSNARSKKPKFAFDDVDDTSSFLSKTIGAQGRGRYVSYDVNSVVGAFSISKQIFSKDQDHFFSVKPGQVLTLDDLYSVNLIAPSSTPGQRPTEVLFFSNNPPAATDSASEVYYFWNGAWHKVGSGAAVIDSKTAVSSYFIVRENESAGDRFAQIPNAAMYYGGTPQNAPDRPWVSSLKALSLMTLKVNGDLILNSNKTWDLSKMTINATNSFSINQDSHGYDIYVNGNLNITSDGAVDLSQYSIYVSGNFSLNAKGGVTLSNTLPLQVGGTITIQSGTAGTINLGAGIAQSSSLATAGDIAIHLAIDSVNGFNLVDNSSSAIMLSSENIALTTGNLLTSAITASNSGLIDLNAGDTISLTGSLSTAGTITAVTGNIVPSGTADLGGNITLIGSLSEDSGGLTDIDDIIVSAHSVPAKAGSAGSIFIGLGTNLKQSSLLYDKVDINRDGISDISIQTIDSSGIGHLYIAFGSKKAVSNVIDFSKLDGKSGFRIDGIEVNQGGYFNVYSYFDANGDGTNDLIITSGSNYDKQYVVFSKSGSFPASINLNDLNGDNGFAVKAGYDFTPISDVNNDGIMDFGIQKRDGYGGSDDPNADKYVVYGTKNGYPRILDPVSLNHRSGIILRGFGIDLKRSTLLYDKVDINRDGINDISVQTVDSSGIGHLYIAFGKKGTALDTIDFSKLDGKNGFRIDSIPVNVWGYYFYSYFDVNGDGSNDLLITAGSYYDKQYVVLSKLGSFPASININDLNGSNGFAIKEGYHFTPISDINNDGIVDLGMEKIADSGDDPNADKYVVYGTKNGYPRILDPVNLNHSSGIVLRGFGANLKWSALLYDKVDINRDGISDISIETTDSAGIGHIYIAFGKKGTALDVIDFSKLDGKNGFRIDGIPADQWGYFNPHSYFDANGDGTNDLLITAGANFDKQYVVLSKSGSFPASININDLNGSNGFAIKEGYSLTPIGDVNNDGVTDFGIQKRNGYGYYSDSDDPNADKYVVYGKKSGYPSILDPVSLAGGSIVYQYWGDTTKLKEKNSFNAANKKIETLKYLANGVNIHSRSVYDSQERVTQTLVYDPPTSDDPNGTRLHQKIEYNYLPAAGDPAGTFKVVTTTNYTSAYSESGFVTQQRKVWYNADGFELRSYSLSDTLGNGTFVLLSTFDHIYERRSANYIIEHSSYKQVAPNPYLGDKDYIEELFLNAAGKVTTQKIWDDTWPSPNAVLNSTTQYEYYSSGALKRELSGPDSYSDRLLDFREYYESGELKVYESYYGVSHVGDVSFQITRRVEWHEDGITVLHRTNTFYDINNQNRVDHIDHYDTPQYERNFSYSFLHAPLDEVNSLTSRVVYHYDVQSRIDYIVNFNGNTTVPARTEDYLYYGEVPGNVPVGYAGKLKWVIEYVGQQGTPVFDSFNQLSGVNGEILSVQSYGYDEKGSSQFILSTQTYYAGDFNRPKEFTINQRLSNGDVVQRYHETWDEKSGRLSTHTDYSYNTVGVEINRATTHYDSQGRIDYIEHFEGSAAVLARIEDYLYYGEVPGNVPAGYAGKLKWVIEYEGQKGTPVFNSVNQVSGVNGKVLSVKSYGYSTNGSSQFILSTQTYYAGSFSRPKEFTLNQRLANGNIVPKYNETWGENGKLSTHTDYSYNTAGVEIRRTITHYDFQGKVVNVEYIDNGSNIARKQSARSAQGRSYTTPSNVAQVIDEIQAKRHVLSGSNALPKGISSSDEIAGFVSPDKNK